MGLLNTSYTHTRSMLRGEPATRVVLVVISRVALMFHVVVVTVRAAPVPLGNPCGGWLRGSQARCPAVRCKGACVKAQEYAADAPQ
jgi:hypothetical protein